MNMRHASFLGLLAVLALPALSAQPAAPAASAAPTTAAAPAAQGISGKWIASVDAGGTPLEITFDLKGEGEKLTGSLNVMGAPTAITDGTVKGEDVSFKIAFDMGQGGPPLAISYVGKLKGDTLNLTSTFSMGDGAPPNATEVVAKRVK